MVCEPPEGFSALGFRDSEHAVFCNARDILDAHATLEADPARAQSIANAARRVVAENHSVAARTLQIGAALGRISDGRFVGSRWTDGTFTFLSTDASPLDSGRDETVQPPFRSTPVGLKNT